ncbi:THYMIDINE PHOSPHORYLASE (TDRPASE) [Mycoplasmopsis pulmonis]|uniref:THYMIDINE PHOSPHORYLASE (TDRPASE) n=1 Tax=Mycoplasmopsis pulmonis (strain UAB CTIP) TaxID=272635 RepID=Q98PS3_MYCPU|nr:thymidine phosphorylase [Mycoplasmopsis pulmonis]MDZ7293669.1 thymidine phosphorylase [Mycoplasmopsis pulmonis]CAC13819.1 THYMIDINE PHOSPHORYLASE (TDRPASE) [Mycoplasmopsis pulmonis]VEU68409.1 Pyrimidine-nucleoside phosphorylase [Mycoplasmopsis pulmonis]
MRIVDLINKKMTGKALTKEEIDFLLDSYLNESMPDYQMAAFLMAVVFKSMEKEELAHFSLKMLQSGKIIDLSSIKQIKVDKHSTGGIGDKTTLVIAPIIAALDLPVAKMSGRGLGHTGGTLDKLESIPGFRINLSEEEFINQVKKINISVISQSQSLVPLDKKLYALRDVTATVESIPLIASSIMSKKLATGSDAILLDVKCGNGAFMKDIDRARELAKHMVDIGKVLNKDVVVEITNMDRPLGKEIGNKNEVIEAIEALKDKWSWDFKELIYSSCINILLMTKKASTNQEAKTMIDSVIKSGKALEKFYEFVQAQGGDVEILKSKSFWNPKFKLEIKANSNGYLNIYDALTFGIVAMKLGAGRQTKEEKIDFEAGISLNKKTNDLVKKGDVIFSLYSSKPIDPSLIDELKNSWKISESKVDFKMILDKF